MIRCSRDSGTSCAQQADQWLRRDKVLEYRFSPSTCEATMFPTDTLPVQEIHLPVTNSGTILFPVLYEGNLCFLQEAAPKRKGISPTD